MYAAYDLQLDDGGNDDDRASAVTENIISESVEDSGIDSDDNLAAVKAFSGKTNDEIKKMMETFRENHEKRDLEGSIGEQLFNEFNNILSIEGVGAVN